MCEFVDMLLTKVICGSAKDASDAGWSQKHLEQLLMMGNTKLWWQVSSNTEVERDLAAKAGMCKVFYKVFVLLQCINNITVVLGVLVLSQFVDGLGKRRQKPKTKHSGFPTATEDWSGTDCRAARWRTVVLPRGQVSWQDRDNETETDTTNCQV